MRSLSLTLGFSNESFHSVDKVISETDSIRRLELLDIELKRDGSCLLLYHLTGDTVSTLEQVLSDHPSVISSQLLSRDNDYYLFVHTDPEDPLTELLDIADRHTLLITKPLKFTGDYQLHVTVAGEQDALQPAIEDVPSDVSVSINNLCEYCPNESVLGLLTERQQEAIEAALELGYYETPRQTTWEDIAAELECASSTANTVLRQAEKTLISALLV